jgi:hypothetical protein
MRMVTEVSDDEEVIISKRKRGSQVPAYDCIGGNMEYQTGIPGFKDLYLIIQGMSKQTAWIWWEFVKTRDRCTNEVVYVATTLVERNRLTLAYKELSRLDLVQRIRKQHYLINPLAIFPEHREFKLVSQKWSDLKRKEGSSYGSRLRSA